MTATLTLPADPRAARTNRIPVAVLGATGSVGQRFVQLLEHHPWFRLHEVVASERSAGKSYADAAGRRPHTPPPPAGPPTPRRRPGAAHPERPAGGGAAGSPPPFCGRVLPGGGEGGGGGPSWAAS